MTTSGLFRHARILTALIALPALSAGLLAAAPAAQARPAPSAAAVRPAVPRLGRLSAAAASARAHATHKNVIVSSLTTPTSQTTARPNGTFLLTESLRPVRAWRAGGWHALNPDLSVGPGKKVTPAITTSPLTLSDGGSGPLATLDSQGWTMTLTWPWTLPTPTLSGPTATYADVIPGVDLVLTVTPQGGFSDVLVIHSAAAAANPLLSSLQITAQTPGMQLQDGADGVLTAATSANAPPVFTALAPQMWDSTPVPAGTQTMTTPDGIVLAAPSGFPASSSTTGPGASAQVFPVDMSVSGQDITLTPPAAGLTGSNLTYPVYLDPSFQADPIGSSASNWTQISEGYPSTSYWDTSSDLQLGLCDNSAGGCNGVTVVRFYVKMPVSSALTTSTSINSADLSMDDVWSDSCTAAPVQIWTSGQINPATTWNNPNGLITQLQSQSFAFGHDSSCGSFKNDVTWNVTSAIQADAGHVTSQSFGLKAANESTVAGWKQFDSGSSNLTMSISYHNPPTKPSALTNEPAGACSTSSTNPAVIGNDDVTLNATVGDVDDVNGDSSLTSTFVLKNSSGTTVDTVNDATGNAVGGTKASATLTRTFMTGLSAGSANYSWSVTTKDAGSPVLTSPASPTCYFTYNPAGPAAPAIVFANAGSIDPSEISAPLGTPEPVTIEPPPGCGTGSAPACPTSFTYQLGDAPQVTVSANPSTGDWSGTFTVAQVGPEPITAFGKASGNIGASGDGQLTGFGPNTPFEDGYYGGSSFPSLLTLGTVSSTNPSLWLSSGSGNGTLSPAVDIGDLGTSLNLTGASTGPAQWAGAQIVHGNLAEQNTQDVLAYYPSLGSGVIVAGSAGSSELMANGPNIFQVPVDSLTDTDVTGSSSLGPVTLVAAGNASEQCSATDDLIGVWGDSTHPYELDLWSTFPANQIGTYNFVDKLSSTAPDGTADWNNYLLATAQPADPDDATTSTCAVTQPNTDRNNVVLYALDKNTGALYESVNTNLNNPDQTDNPASAWGALVGNDGSWTSLSIPWATSPTQTQIQADINSAGTPELWTVSGSTATPYTISDDTVTQESPAVTIGLPLTHQWPLNDGGAAAGATTATDIVTATAAPVTGSAPWAADGSFGTVFDTTPSSKGYVTPPSGTVSKTDPMISVWFKTSIPLGSSGVLISLQADALSTGTTTTAGYDPVMYVGTDGKLHALWYQGSSSAAIISANPVNDGQWHQAVLSYSGGTQTLTIDGSPQGSTTGTLNVSGLPALNFGAGYIGGHWLDETNNGNTGAISYFNGDIADVTYSQ